MKRQIRRGVFETNSSSVHSITMCSESEFDKWKNGEVLFWGNRQEFATREKIISEMRNERWYRNTTWENEDEVKEIFSDEGVKTYEEFFDGGFWYGTYCAEHTTANGEKVIAFGYYGHD